MGNRAGGRRTGPKCIAIVGPFASGKTTLLEAILARTGAIPRQNPVSSGNTVSDNSPEAKAHSMSVEASVASVDFMGDSLTFVDCPGSVEFAFEADPVLAACDLAVVVAEADEKKIPALQLIMRKLDDLAIPHIMFLNKTDKSSSGVRDTLKMLQPASAAPLLLRQIPLRKAGAIVGSIDLALERAYIWRDFAESEITEIPSDEKAREVEARFSMLETLADHDDVLMEQLLEEREPPRDEIFDDLAADLRDGSVIPVLIGAAEKGNGVLRLLKAIRHDAPDVATTRKRLGLEDGTETVAQVIKTIHTAHGGKLSICRVLSGKIVDGTELWTSNGEPTKVSGIYRMLGKDQAKLAAASAGDTVALGKLESAKTGQTLTSAKAGIASLAAIEPPQSVYAFSLRSKQRKDDVKMSAAIHRLAEEDPSLTLHHNQDSGETVLSGHGEMHLRVAVERLEGRNQISIDVRPPAIPYRETIRKSTSQRGRHKKQSGGHGQFGDVVLEIKPLPRGSGFVFSDTITGGVVPKQYIQSVESGVRDYLKSGPLGFPVVDLAVNLSDGSYHSVDSSDMAFQMAARIAMKEGMAQCSPILLEPIMKVEIVTPEDYFGDLMADLGARRAEITNTLDRGKLKVIEARAPLEKMFGYSTAVRSLSQGRASYSMEPLEYAAAPDSMLEILVGM